MSAATAAQREYIANLAYATRTPPQDYGRVDSFEEASSAIDYLRNVRRRMWSREAVHPDVRKHIFATIRARAPVKEARVALKESMYAAVGITSLSEASSATALDARRCCQWLDGQPLEPPCDDPYAVLSRDPREPDPRPERPPGYSHRNVEAVTDRDRVFSLSTTDVVMSETNQATPPSRSGPPRGRIGFVPPPSVAPAVKPVAQAAPAASASVSRPVGRPGLARPAPVAAPVAPAALPKPVAPTTTAGARPVGRPGLQRPVPTAAAAAPVAPVELPPDAIPGITSQADGTPMPFRLGTRQQAGRDPDGAERGGEAAQGAGPDRKERAGQPVPDGDRDPRHAGVADAGGGVVQPLSVLDDSHPTIAKILAEYPNWRVLSYEKIVEEVSED